MLLIILNININFPIAILLFISSNLELVAVTDIDTLKTKR